MGSLTRSRIHRRIAGVCGGIAEQNGWDPTVIRLIWVALVLFGGTGVLAYVVLWLVLPEAPYVLPHQAYAGPYTETAGGYYPPQPGVYPGGSTYQAPPQPPPGPRY